MAKSFGLRETPGRIGGGSNANNKASTKTKPNTKRKRADDSSGDEMDAPKALGKASAAKTDAERRMYEAVRKQGRLTKGEGKMGAMAGGDGEYQVMSSTKDLEKMVGGGKRVKRS